MARQQIDKSSLTESGLPDNRPTAYMDWGKAADGALEYGARLDDFKVFLRCHDSSMTYSWIMSRWHPGGDPKKSQLILVCPWCSQQLRVPGEEKTFQFEILDNPFAVLVPGMEDNEDAKQVARLSVREDLGCPACMRYFRLTDNTLHAVR